MLIILIEKIAQIMCDGIINGKLKEGGDLSARQAKTGRRSTKRNTMHPSLFKKLSEVCNVNLKYSSYSHLTFLGVRICLFLFKTFIYNQNNLYIF